MLLQKLLLELLPLLEQKLALLLQKLELLQLLEQKLELLLE